ncbi:2-dehydro-3-deoxy-D-gluconate 5-dehydrogenase [Clostridiales bacterium]|nr:2-dehydro-3-deoxy-D-gluconate 5-dehydrogenase [Clostridiales bacterium]
MKQANIIDRFRLDGKVALVTGGSGYYGKQMVIALADAGATVCCASRGVDKCREFTDSLNAAGYDKVYADQYDQADEASINALLERMTARDGKVDILVNNSVLRPMHDYEGPAADFAKSMEVNATGLFLISRAFGNQMEKNGGGSIINIGSYMGICGSNPYLYEDNPEMDAIDAPDYFYHKGGMLNLTRFLAGRYGKSGVRVNCLNLGGLFNHQPADFLERYAKMTYLGRMANESDIQGVLVFLASDASAYITGTSINVDGGYTAR